MTQSTGFSLEAIKQQSTAFYDGLTAIIESYSDAKLTELRRSGFTKELEQFIRSEKNMNVRIIKDSDYIGTNMISAYFTNPTDPKGPRAADLNGVTQLEFNFNDAKLGGDWRDVPLSIIFDLSIMTKTQYTPRMIAAVLLHEIGHLFFDLYLISNTARYNQALARVAMAFDNQTDISTRKIIFKKEFGSLGYDTEEIDELNSLNRLETVYTTGMAMMGQRIVNQLGSDVYDMTVSEYMADEFASRHGAGMDLVKARAMNTGAESDWWASLNLHIYGTTGLAFLFAYVMASTSMPVVIAYASMTLFFNYLAFRSNRNTAFSYDRVKDRLTRIRNQVQLRMRTLAKTKEQVEAFKKELRVIDQQLEVLQTSSDFFTNKLFLLFSGKTRRRLAQTELEMKYEELAHNKLFEKALEFKFN